MYRKGLIAILLALLLVIMSGCTTYMPGSMVSGSDAELLITNSDLTAELTNIYEEYFDDSNAVTFYYDGYTFVGTTLCNAFRCEDGSNERSIAVMADFPRYSYAMEDGVWYERIYDDGGADGYNMPIEPMPSYSDFAVPYRENAHYNTLSDEDKAIYDEMYDKLKSLEPLRYTPDDMSEEDIYYRYNIYMSIAEDHPVLRSYVLPCETVEYDTIEDYKLLSYDYSYHVPGSASDLSTDDIRTALAKYDEICDEIVTSMPEGLSTYAKYLYLAQRLCAMTEYNYDYEHLIGGPCAPILFGKGLCQEYSEAYCELCRKAGLSCTTVSGTSQGVSHGWNLIELEEGTYHVDLTWADSGSIGDETFMSYFALTQDEILEDHDTIIDGTVATGIKSFR